MPDVFVYAGYLAALTIAGEVMPKFQDTPSAQSARDRTSLIHMPRLVLDYDSLD